MNWYKLEGESILGPYSPYSPEVREATRASNPEVLDLRQYGFVPGWYEPVDAPLGWQAPVIEIQGGEQVAAFYASGSIEERNAAALAAAKEAAHSARYETMLAHRNGGFVYDGHIWESDTESRMLIMGAVQIATFAVSAGTQEALTEFSSTLGSGWRDIDGTPVITSAVGMISLGMALAAHIATCDGVSMAHKVAINAAEEVADVWAVDLSLGWPEVAI